MTKKKKKTKLKTKKIKPRKRARQLLMFNKKKNERKPSRKRNRKISKEKKIRKSKKLKLKNKRAVKNNRPSTHRSSLPRYYLNRQFQYMDELMDLVLKSSPEEKEKMTEGLLKLGRVKLAIATGIFLNKVNAEAIATDLFIVGDDISRRKLRSFLKSLEADVGKEVRYVVMEKEEFQYRMGMFDRFIRVILEGPHEKLINRLGI